MSRKARNEQARPRPTSAAASPPPSAWDAPSALDYSPVLDGRPSALDRPSRLDRPRGGRRPGAGAPPANLNAYKHGHYSRQHKELVQLLVVLKARLPAPLVPLLTRLLEDAGTGAELRRLRVDLDQVKARLEDLRDRAALQEDFQSEPAAA